MNADSQDAATHRGWHGGEDNLVSEHTRRQRGEHSVERDRRRRAAPGRRATGRSIDKIRIPEREAAGVPLLGL
jgi:hypothetical protein